MTRQEMLRALSKIMLTVYDDSVLRYDPSDADVYDIYHGYFD